jgi:Flp pilus assembly protein TadD
MGLAACGPTTSPEDAKMSVALCAQGKAMLASGKRAEARDIYQSAVSRDENNARAWNGLGVSYDVLGKHADAKSAYQQALELAPDDMTAANNLAHLYLEEGDAAAAVRLLSPFRNMKATPAIVKQNLVEAERKLQVKESAKNQVREPVNEEQQNSAYADLGSYATEGLAKGYLGEAKSLLNDQGGLSYAVEPEVKIGGGTPVFAVKVRGGDPQKVCRVLKARAFPCLENR